MYVEDIKLFVSFNVVKFKSSSPHACIACRVDKIVECRVDKIEAIYVVRAEGSREGMTLANKHVGTLQNNEENEASKLSRISILVWRIHQRNVNVRWMARGILPQRAHTLVPPSSSDSYKQH